MSPLLSAKADFFVQCLADCRDKISKELDINPEEVELSMGMSGDFEPAVGVPLFPLLMSIGIAAFIIFEVHGNTDVQNMLPMM